jgi:hypothetical protein
MREVGGLVFVWLGVDAEPDPFDAADEDLARALRGQGLARARVAHQIDYAVQANWKLVWHERATQRTMMPDSGFVPTFLDELPMAADALDFA